MNILPREWREIHKFIALRFLKTGFLILAFKCDMYGRVFSRPWSKSVHGPFRVSITDKLLTLKILDLENVQISRSKQWKLLQSFLDLFGFPDQVTNRLLIPILTCQWPGSKYNEKYITTSFRPFCIPNITPNKLLILLSEFLKVTWCQWCQFY